MEQQHLLFVYFLSIFELILVLTDAILIVLDRTAWDRFLCHDWLTLYSPLSWHSSLFLGLEVQLRLSVG